MNVEHEKKNEVILKHIEIDIQNVKRVLNIKDGQTWKNFSANPENTDNYFWKMFTNI